MNAIAEMIAYSNHLEQECVANSIRFFDTSENFLDVLDEVYSYLKGK